MAKRIAVVGLLLVGCGAPYSPPEDVRIVTVRCETRKGQADCNTVVEFPDGTRWMRGGKWGEVGDTFTASREMRRNYPTVWRTPRGLADER